MGLFDERQPPDDFPCFFKSDGLRLVIADREHYDYINDKADMLYQTIYGYKSQTDFDYFCSSHPQEQNMFTVAMVMDDWCRQHDFNDKGGE